MTGFDNLDISYLDAWFEVEKILDNEPLSPELFSLLRAKILKPNTSDKFSYEFDNFPRVRDYKSLLDIVDKFYEKYCEIRDADEDVLIPHYILRILCELDVLISMYESKISKPKMQFIEVNFDFNKYDLDEIERNFNDFISSKERIYIPYIGKHIDERINSKVATHLYSTDFQDVWYTRFNMYKTILYGDN